MSSPSPANPANIVVCEHARFTFLTDRLMRLEWADDGLFEDLATLRVCNRSTDFVAFTKEEKGGKLILKTRYLTLTYQQDGKKFSKKNLSITFKTHGKNTTWWPGKKDKLNLKGTAKTLDEFEGGSRQLWVRRDEVDPERPVLATRYDDTQVWQGDSVDLPIEDGLISRNGWAVVDDSESVVLDPALCSWQPWVRERHDAARQDLYFLGYGLAYKDALRDASLIFGKQTLLPRYALGYWYSRYWAYTDKELKQLVEDFDRMQLPLDVLVIDMDWHKLGWTGYTWDPDFFPDPQGLLSWLRKKGIKITLNLHPAEGVLDFEDAFPEMVKEMGLEPSELQDLPETQHKLYRLMGRDIEGAKHIPLDICDPNYMQAYFKCLHHPLEKMGVDFWWMDWQQGNQGANLPNLNTLPWINELHWQDQRSHQPEKRALNFSRFGGVGAGRMPVGFSGDTIVTWKSLAYQPWFTATASNILFGTWSHDIGGHMNGTLTPELYTRWIQFGVYSPILRTHTSKAAEAERRIFHFPEPSRSIMTRMLERRYELVPYIYGNMRKAVDSGVSLLRPMYYEWPKESEAYTYTEQYMFGDDMLVAPVVQPIDEKDEMAEVRVWLPKGNWFDTATGSLLKGGSVHKRRYSLEEVPVFVRPGTVIPEQPMTTRLKKGAYPKIRFRIYPGKSGTASLYEDDGETEAWQNGDSAEIQLTHEKSGNLRRIVIEPVKGGYKGFKAQRTLSLVLDGFAPPVSVSSGKWSYNGDEVTVEIDCGKVNLEEGFELTIEEAPPATQTLAKNLKGYMTRLEKVRAYNCQISPANPVYSDERLAVKAAQTGNRISLKPESFREEVKALHGILERLPKALKEYQQAWPQLQKEEPDFRVVALEQARNILKTVKDL
ncbi:glycoside hydrolase family 31 protein [Kiritimatiellota bacterium B12222]|nr:glycoside hydrolase family 31 protein [Kiritimatiellota bacterium B12222]